MITAVSIGGNYREPLAGDIDVPAYCWPTPPPVLRPLDGRDRRVAEAVLYPMPVVLDELRIVAEYARSLTEHQDEVTVVVECNEGIHRSVAGAEFIAEYAGRYGADTRVIHRDLGRRGS